MKIKDSRNILLKFKFKIRRTFENLFLTEYGKKLLSIEIHFKFLVEG